MKDQIRNSHESKIDEADRYSIKTNMKNNDDIALHHLTILQSTPYEIDSKTTINVIDSEPNDNHQVFQHDVYSIEGAEILTENYTTEKDLGELENSIMFDKFLQHQQQYNDDVSFRSQNDLCDNCHELG
jgi:hypothetical protein